MVLPKVAPLRFFAGNVPEGLLELPIGRFGPLSFTGGAPGTFPGTYVVLRLLPPNLGSNFECCTVLVPQLAVP